LSNGNLNGLGYSVQTVNKNSTKKPAPRAEDGPVSFLFDQQGKRKYLTASERNAFLAAAARQPSDTRTFCLVLAYTGARISEILALTPRHIDGAAGVVIIECLKKRRRGIFRALPIPSELFAELDCVYRVKDAQRDEYRANQRIWRWCRTTAWGRVKQCMREAQISGYQAMPKGLRHAFGVSVVQSGVPISLLKKWLGHSRLETTEIYAAAVGAEEQAIACRFWQTFSSNSNAETAAGRGAQSAN
jgi:integrase/recombinase XerD